MSETNMKNRSNKKRRRPLTEREKEILRKRRAKRKRRLLIRRILVILLILLLLVLIFLIGHALLGNLTEDDMDSGNDNAKKSTNLSIESDSSIAEETDTYPITITVSSMGDCTLGTDENFDQSTSLPAYYNSKGPDYFFQNVRSILEEDDLSIVNFEGTLTEETARADKTFAFKADPEYTKILTGSSVEAANQANNHSHDYGEKSFTDTTEALQEAGITTFGYEDTAIYEVKGIKIGLTGIYELATHEGCSEMLKENIASLKEEGADVIIVNFHWGVEKEYYPNATQVSLAHTAIDEGADLVIGHHPHVLEGVELYNGKYIAYSLGNFCFGGNKNPSDKDTMIFQMSFTITEDGVADSTEADMNIIPCRLSSTTSCNDYCPTPLEGGEAQAVLDKIEKYSEGL